MRTTPFALLVAAAAAAVGIAQGQRTPQISYISEEQVKDIGGTVDLVCSVQYSQDYPVLWLKIDDDGYGDLPISSNTALIIRDSRFALRYDPSSTTFTLQIKDIQEHDAGTYRCQILISTTSAISSEVTLGVRKPPLIVDNPARSQLVREGQSVQLECFAVGLPKPRISWRRQNNAILPTGGPIYRGSILKIASVSKDDRGTYYCVAENGVGRGARHTIDLQVEFAPEVSVVHSRLGQALDYDQNLVCQIEAYPPASVTWYKGEERVGGGQHYSTSSYQASSELLESTLRIIKVEPKHYGEYTCKAQNKLGTAQARVELYETYKPECPPACGPTKRRY
ncbi:hypothetical protein TKK_0000693 [Trichogramma kaykai]